MKYSEYYAELKADPVRYAAYLKRKREEAHDRRVRGVPCRSSWELDPALLRAKMKGWRERNRERSNTLRRAQNAVHDAVRSGKLIKPSSCSECGGEFRIQAHHHHGYEREHLLDVVWLCDSCHKKQHRTVGPRD